MENNSLEFVAGDENKFNSALIDSDDGYSNISTWYENLCGESNSKNDQLLYLNNNMSDRKWSQSLFNLSDNNELRENGNAEMRNLESQIETSKQVLKLEVDSGLPITQVNGQRILGPPPGWIGPPPDSDCEIFVGKIPRNLYENELYPIFRSIGEIYEVRLMMDFSGTNRGYCFVKYTTVSDANRAIRKLNNYEIRPGRKIGVLLSVNNCRLCVSQLPHDLDTEIFIRKICETTTEVKNVAIYRYPDGRIKNALISYNKHIAAVMGRRRLVPDRANLFPGVDLMIDWAHPKLTPYKVIEESGVVDDNDHVEIHKRYIDSNKKSTKNTSRDEFLNESIASYIEDEDECHRYKSGDSSFQREFKNSTRRQNYVGRKKLNDSNRASSECNIRIKNNTQQFPIGSGKKIANHNKKKENNHHFRKLRDVNGNFRSYKSSMELSTEIPNEFHNLQFNDKLIYRGSNGQDKENISYNYNNMFYDGNNIIPFTREQSYINNCANFADNTAAIVRSQSAAMSDYIEKNFIPYFGQGLNLESDPFNHEFHKMKEDNQPWVHNRNLPSKYSHTSSINVENNPLMMQQSNGASFRGAFPQINYNIYHENLIGNDHPKNCYLENISRDANVIQTDQSVDHNYNIRYDNNHALMPNEFSVVNSLNDNHKMVINNGMALHVPKFNTKSFGLGRAGLTIRNDNQNRLIKHPRPILSRNTIKNVV